MPFKSEKQRRFLHANHPEIAQRWENKYNTGGEVMGLLDKRDQDVSITIKKPNGASVTYKSPEGAQIDMDGILGGIVEGQSPSPVADDKMIKVTSGEYVVNHPATQKYKPFLDAINEEGKQMLAMGGEIEGYALGGPTHRDHDRIVWLRELLETLEPGSRDFEMVKSLIVDNPKGYYRGGEVLHNEPAPGTWAGDGYPTLQRRESVQPVRRDSGWEGFNPLNPFHYPEAAVKGAAEAGKTGAGLAAAGLVEGVGIIGDAIRPALEKYGSKYNANKAYKFWKNPEKREQWGKGGEYYNKYTRAGKSDWNRYFELFDQLEKEGHDVRQWLDAEGYALGGEIEYETPELFDEVQARAEAGDPAAIEALKRYQINFDQSGAGEAVAVTPVPEQYRGLEGSWADESYSPAPPATQPETTWTPVEKPWEFNPQHDITPQGYEPNVYLKDEPTQPRRPFHGAAQPIDLSAEERIQHANKVIKNMGRKEADAAFAGKVDNETAKTAADILANNDSVPAAIRDLLGQVDTDIRDLEGKRKKVRLFSLALASISGEPASAAAAHANAISGGDEERINELYGQRKEILNRLLDKALEAEGFGAIGEDDEGNLYKRPFSIRYRDPNTGEEQVRAGRLQNGEYQLQNEAGEWVPAQEVAGSNDYQVTSRGEIPDVEPGAGGIPNAVSYSGRLKVPTFTFRREGEQKTYGYALRAIVADRKLAGIEGEVGIEKLGQLYAGIQQWAARNAQGSLTAATLNKLIGDAGLSQYSREMSKFLQAILRTDTGAAYTGTEITDYLSAFGISPGQAFDQNTLKDFQDGRAAEIYGLVGRTGAGAPYLTGLLDGKYDLPDFSAIERGTGGSVEQTGDGVSGTTNGVNWSVEK